MVPKVPPGQTWIRLGNPVTPTVIDFGAPRPSPADAPPTDLVVQLSIAAEAHPDDVAAVMERLQAAMRDAEKATAGRIALKLDLPHIVRSELVRTTA